MIIKFIVVFIAISVALTTKSSSVGFKQSYQNLFLNFYAVWGIQPNQVSNQHPTIAQLNVNTQEVLYVGFLSLSSLGYNSLDEYILDLGNPAIDCTTNSNKICMAYVRYNTVPSAGTILGVLDGDYYHGLF